MRRSAAEVLLMTGLSLGLGTVSMYAAIPFLFAIVFVGRQRDWRRLHASMLLGTAAAWLLLPATMERFDRHVRGPIDTTLTGCHVMALGGFPFQQVSGHGGGGWRLGSHLFSDQVWHAVNCSVLSVVFWLGLRFVRPRRLSWLHWCAWGAFVRKRPVAPIC